MDRNTDHGTANHATRQAKYVVYTNQLNAPAFRCLMNLSVVNEHDLDNVKVVGFYRTIFFANAAFYESYSVPIRFVLHDIGFSVWTIYRRLYRGLRRIQ